MGGANPDYPQAASKIQNPNGFRLWPLALMIIIASVLVILGPVLLNFSTRTMTRLALDAGNPGLAEEIISLVIVLKPGSAPLHDALGYAQYLQGRVPEAQANFERAVSLDAAFPTAHNNLGVTLFSQEEVSRAVEHLQAAVRLDPANSVAYCNLANVYLKTGERRLAAENYHLAYKLDPGQIDAQAHWAAIALEEDRLAEARAAWQQVIAVDPVHAIARRGLGVIAFRESDQAGAVVHLQAALAADPYDPVARLYLGLALEAAGRLPEAAAEFERVIVLSVDWDLVSQAKAHLAAIRQSLNPES